MIVVSQFSSSTFKVSGLTLRCLWPMLKPKAVWMSMVRDAAGGHVDVCDFF